MEFEVVTETGATLEELFFARQDAELNRRYREEWAKMARRDALESASGIRDGAVIERLLALGLTAQTVAALSLYPLVAVAWADHHMDGREKDAIMSAASKAGVTALSSSRVLLEYWLADPPGKDMRDAWLEFVGALKQSMKADELEALKTATLGQARAVAQAAGGLLGAMTVSEKEEAMLQFLELAFD